MLRNSENTVLQLSPLNLKLNLLKIFPLSICILTTKHQNTQTLSLQNLEANSTAQTFLMIAIIFP